MQIYTAGGPAFCTEDQQYHNGVEMLTCPSTSQLGIEKQIEQHEEEPQDTHYQMVYGCQTAERGYISDALISE